MFVHLHVHSPYSFLDGASSLEDYLQQAADLGMPALALTDHNSLSGAVEFQKKAKQLGIKPILGAEITTKAGFHLTLLAENDQGYRNICQLLTGSTEETSPITAEKLATYHKGLIVLSGCRRSAVVRSLLCQDIKTAEEAVHELVDIFGRHQVYLEMINTYLPRTEQLLEGIHQLHQRTGLPLVATNNVHYATKDRFALHDILTCVRTQSTVEDISPARPLNAENYLAAPSEMKQRFNRYPEACAHTLEITARCRESLKLGQSLFPRFPVPSDQKDNREFFISLVYRGAEERYGTITPEIKERLEHEIEIISKLDVVDYFLAVWDVVQYARRHNIRYAGRGSAADSAVAYCLKITNVDAISRGLLFERFLSLERSQKPDIDIDFAADKRDQVADYVYKKYGREHVASVCTFSTFRARSALRDFAKALGYPKSEVEKLVKNIPYFAPADGIEHVLAQLPELKGHVLSDSKYRPLLQLCAQAAGFPRHIGTHLGGLVISGPPITTVTPLQKAAKGVLITQFDKHTIEDLGLIKLDLLSLRTLSAVNEVDTHLQSQGLAYDQIPTDDRSTYKMLNSGETVGVFQLESPAQRQLQTRLQADHMEDLVASVALIRPGPIKGDMVEPFLAHRHGLKEPNYIHPSLQPILSKTYGVVLYQEQVIEIASKIAGFTPGDSDALRRAMTSFRSHNQMEQIGELFIEKAVARDVPREIAETIFSYIVGYAGYGFCEAHAAAFADTAYRTAYLLKHFPSHYYAALLNHQPLGFYSPNTLCQQAKLRGITILPLNILASEWDFKADQSSIRIGLKQVKGLEKSQGQAILKARQQKPFRSFADFVMRTELDRDIIANLVLAGAFDYLQANRRQLLWQINEYLQTKKNQLFIFNEKEEESIADFPAKERWLHEYQVLGIAAKQHVMEFFRPQLDQEGFLTGKQARHCQSEFVKTAGLVIRPHRPPTRSGKTVIFLTLEDETGLIDVVIFEDIYKKFSKVIYNQPLLKIWGHLSRRRQSVSIIANRIAPIQ